MLAISTEQPDARAATAPICAVLTARPVAEALARVGTHDERIFEPELHRLHGELLRAGVVADPAGAEASFQRALEIARRQGAKSWELRAAVSLARLWRSSGRTVDAHRLLTDTTAWFTEGFDTADLRAARELLNPSVS